MKNYCACVDIKQITIELKKGAHSSVNKFINILVESGWYTYVSRRIFLSATNFPVNLSFAL